MTSQFAERFVGFPAAGTARPFVVGQIGQSLDGRVATEAGDARDINGAAGLDHLHALRDRVDAVLVGAQTVMNDDPRLTVRRVAGRDPARVVIDPRGRTPADKQWLAPGVRRILVTACDNAPVAAHCDETIRLPLREGVLDPTEIVAALAARGLPRLLVEGGAHTLGAFIAAGALARLHIVVAPIMLGSGKPSLRLPIIERLTQALRPEVSVHAIGGGETLFDCDLGVMGGR